MRIVLLAALLLAGCSDPTITITIANPPPRELAGGPVTTTLSVVLADDAITCDDVRYGLISAETLAGGRQASVAADGSGHITGVPRLGHKLFLLEAVNQRGRRIAGGCEALDDIVEDAAVVVEAKPSLRARLVSARDPGQPAVDGEAVSVLVRKAWGELPADAVEVLQVAVRDSDEVVGGGSVVLRASDGDDTIYEVTLTAPPSTVGPSEIELRPSWSDEVLRIPTFTKPVGLGFQPLGDRSRGPNRRPPSWAVLIDDAATPGDDVRAAAISGRGTGVQLVMFEEQGDALSAPIVAEASDLRALVTWKGAILTRLAALPGPTPTPRWSAIDWTTHTLAPLTIADPQGSVAAADDLVAVECGANQLGLLARSGNGPYEAFTEPGTLGDATTAIGEIAAKVNALGGNGHAIDAVASRCLSLPIGLRAAVIVRVESFDRVATHVVGRDFELEVPATSGVTTYQNLDGAWVLAGSENGVDGPRLVNYRLTQLKLPDLPPFLALPLSLELQVAAPPSSILVFERDRSLLPDTIAAIELDGATRVQSTTGRPIGVRPLSGLTAPMVGGAPRLAAVDLLEAGDLRQILVMTSEGISASDPTRAAVAKR